MNVPVHLFDGDPEYLLEFIDKIIILKKSFNLTNAEACYYFRRCLIGSALHIYDDLSVDVRYNLDSLIYIFKNRILTSYSKFMLGQKFRLRCKKRNESIIEFGYSLKNLARTAYDNFDEIYINAILIDQFLYGISKNMSNILITYDFQNFDELLNKAKMLEFRTNNDKVFCYKNYQDISNIIINPVYPKTFDAIVPKVETNDDIISDSIISEHEANEKYENIEVDVYKGSIVEVCDVTKTKNETICNGTFFETNNANISVDCEQNNEISSDEIHGHLDDTCFQFNEENSEFSSDLSGVEVNCKQLLSLLDSRQVDSISSYKYNSLLFRKDFDKVLVLYYIVVFLNYKKYLARNEFVGHEISYDYDDIVCKGKMDLKDKIHSTKDCEIKIFNNSYECYIHFLVMIYILGKNYWASQSISTYCFKNKLDHIKIFNKTDDFNFILICNIHIFRFWIIKFIYYEDGLLIYKFL